MPETPILALVVSLASFVFSVVSLVLTYRQRSRQDRLGSRKALTDTIAAISATNIEMGKLFAQKPLPEIVALRRNLNSQRRYLANHAELLIGEIPELATDIDFNIIAGAFDAIGDFRLNASYLA
jgi:hypothetical protein